jgi:hypothetical protein
MSRSPVLWGHAGVLLAVLLAASRETIPWLAVAPFAGLLIRAAWSVTRPRPVENIKRFGFSEIGIEILGGVLVIAGYWTV